MNPKTITSLFCVVATVLAFFALIMYMKPESESTMTTTTFVVPHCKKAESNSICNGVVLR